MLARKVTQIDRVLDGSQSLIRRPFSAFLDHPNIVLLGDPGAGKTHLFQEAAAAVSGHCVTARSFLNIPAFEGVERIFIDALDEQRAGRGDQSTINEIVRKLFVVRPKQVRIACRAQDWLGDSDLTALKQLFDLQGGVVVLALEVLSREEQQEVLLAHGWKADEVETFLLEAERRGLGEFLLNPQNLLMLHDVVASGTWPISRKELFELSTELSLAEANKEHARSGAGIFMPEELRMPAGGACAARLIADVEGISLKNHEGESDYPSYRGIKFLDPDRALAALGRRVFAADAVHESVDYAHRTIAEFLGAAWLAQAIRAGLPLGRIRALMGIDGHPASELRGLHAWLAVLLPEEACVLINADPYGVLAYGDAGSLSLSSRRQLLVALEAAVDSDPTFGSNRLPSSAIAPLAQDDMVPEFLSILRSKGEHWRLRVLILEILLEGRPLLALRDVLVGIVADADRTYFERYRAVAVLAKIGAAADEPLARVFRNDLGTDEDSLRLRGQILAELYPRQFGPPDLRRLLSDLLSSTASLSVGTLSPFTTSIRSDQIADALDQFEVCLPVPAVLPNWERIFGIAWTMDELLLRALRELAEDLSGERTWRWLQVRHAFRESPTGRTANELRTALNQNPRLLSDITDTFLRELPEDDKMWFRYSEFHDAILHAVSEGQLAEWLLDWLLRANLASAKSQHFYELALGLADTRTDQGRRCFDRLYDLAESSPALLHMREVATRRLLSDDHVRMNLRQAQRKAEESEIRENNLAAFRNNEPAIRSGEDQDLLGWAALVYLGMVGGVDQNAMPIERLVRTLDEHSAEVAIDGFLSMLMRKDFPTLAVVAEASAEDGKALRWWLGVVVGVEELWKLAPDLATFSDDLLGTVLALDLLYPTVNNDEERRLRIGYSWKATVLAARPDLAREAYLTLSRASLKVDKDRARGLWELLHLDELAQFRSDVALELLRDFPCAPRHDLSQLLTAAVREPLYRPSLIKLAHTALIGPNLKGSQRQLWLVAAYLCAPAEFGDLLRKDFEEDPALIWLLRDMVGYEQSMQRGLLQTMDLAFLVSMVGSRYPQTRSPAGGWEGNTNPWDAADFVRALINQIAADPSKLATDTLHALISDCGLASYRDYLKHSLAAQRVRRRDTAYTPPTWTQTIEALCNGRPANAADLHALLVAHMLDLKAKIASTNIDIYKRFWNENQYGQTVDPKPEESCRDVLVELLRPLLVGQGVTVEPEGHMALDKRADIIVVQPHQRIPVELKRDYHAKVWNAAQNQLDRYYTADPEASGLGVYCVFWFGSKRPSKMPTRPGGGPAPTSAAQMESMLQASLTRDLGARLSVIVLDVSGCA